MSHVTRGRRLRDASMTLWRFHSRNCNIGSPRGVALRTIGINYVTTNATFGRKPRG